MWVAVPRQKEIHCPTKHVNSDHWSLQIFMTLRKSWTTSHSPTIGVWDAAVLARFTPCWRSIRYQGISRLLFHVAQREVSLNVFIDSHTHHSQLLKFVKPFRSVGFAALPILALRRTGSVCCQLSTSCVESKLQSSAVKLFAVTLSRISWKFVEHSTPSIESWVWLSEVHSRQCWGVDGSVLEGDNVGLEYKRQCHENDKKLEYNKEYRKRMVECSVCKVMLRKCKMNRHEQTKTHLHNLNNPDNPKLKYKQQHEQTHKQEQEQEKKEQQRRQHKQTIAYLNETFPS